MSPRDEQARGREQPAAEGTAEERAVRQYETLLHRLSHLAESLGTARDHLTIFRDLRDFAIVSVPCIGIFLSLYDAERDAGRSVLVSSHVMSFVERVSDRIGVMRAGRLVAEGTPEELRTQAAQGDVPFEDVFFRLVK